MKQKNNDERKSIVSEYKQIMDKMDVELVCKFWFFNNTHNK